MCSRALKKKIGIINEEMNNPQRKETYKKTKDSFNKGGSEL